MKFFKIVLFKTAIIILMVSNVQAFEASLGAKAGVGFGMLSGSEWKDTVDFYSADNLIHFAFNVGIFSDLEFYRKGIVGIGIQPELLYSATGGGLRNGNINLGAIDYSAYNIYYYKNSIQIPLNAKLKLKAGKGDFYFLLGFDILLNFLSGMDIDYWDNNSNQLVEYSSDTGFNTNLGLNLGFGYDIKFKYILLQIGIVYTHYFLSDDGDSDNDIEESYQNNFTFQVGVAYRFQK